MERPAGAPPAALTRRNRETAMSMEATGKDPRTAILEDREIHAHIKKVLRLRGRAPDVAEDICQRVLMDALTDENLPVDDREQARLYLAGCARHKAIDDERARKRVMNKRVELNAELDADPHARDLEKMAFADRVWGYAVERFPGKADWLFRYLILGETHAEIAGYVGKSPSRVRDDISKMMRTLRGVSYVTALFMLVVGGWGMFEHPGRRTVQDNDLSDRVSHRVEAPAVEPTADQLRDRARDWCSQRVWNECLRDISRAMQLDPNGITEADWKLREKAQDELEGGFNAKPSWPQYRPKAPKK